MCNQTVCLIAAEIERRGIPTACVILLREVGEKIRPPRALAVPYPHGFPLGAPNDPQTQREVILAAFRMLGHAGPAPVNADL